ncbi:uncharacterized protein TNCV_3138071 [Trichonephila clavipes]|nr:uncharacterized protein TNCV_3138071 [Trichonephila clavipes]
MPTLLYPKDSLGNEYYLVDNEGDEFYLTDRKPVFAIKEGKHYYATDKDENEFYPIVNDRVQFIPFLYAKDALGNEKYPQDRLGNQMPLTEQGTGGWRYATDKDGNAFYPTNHNGKEIVYVDKKGNQRYAKKENGDEYYPPNGELACDPSGSPQYARTSDGKVIFPLDAERNESYLKDDATGGSHVIYMGDVLLNRYAKTSNGEEIYPIQVTNQSPRRYKEVILNEKYAKTNLQEAKYPLDEYGNEYTLEISIQIAGKEKDYFPQGYPITNDNWIIVPEVKGFKLISDQLLPKMQANNFINKLYRENKTYRDYVTNVKSTRLSRAARQKYMTMALNNPTQNNPLNPPQIPPNKPKISHQLNCVIKTHGKSAGSSFTY